MAKYFDIGKGVHDKGAEMNGDKFHVREIYNKTLLGGAWFSWYDFADTSHVLVTGDMAEVAVGELGRKFARVTVFESWLLHADEMFSAIIVGDGWESSEDNRHFLHECKSHLTDDGVLLWAVDNKIGTRFLCGDSHLGECTKFFTCDIWKQWFLDSGMPLSKVYYALPGWHMARLVFSDEYTLNRANSHRVEYHYVEPEKIYRDERGLLLDAIDNGGFTMLANSFIFEYRKGKKLKEVIYADMSPDKGSELSSVLLCYGNGDIVKRPLYIGGNIKNIYQYGEELRRRGLSVVAQVYEQDEIKMPHIDAPLLSKVMAATARDSVSEYRKLWERLWECILKSSDITFKSDFPMECVDCGEILARAYLDMVPTNVFYIDDRLYFFDQEYCYKNYPAKYVLYRAMVVLYAAEPQLEDIIPLVEVKKWFDMEKLWSTFSYVDREYFIKNVRNSGLYGEYNKKYVLNERAIAHNKYVLENIEKYAESDLFIDTAEKEIILFGAGVYCTQYLQKYGETHHPVLIVDNNKAKWGTHKKGVYIDNPSCLLIKEKDSFVVIICSKYYQEITKQLEDMGINDYRVF